MIKVMLILIVLMAAYGIAVIMVRRLSEITKQIADLKDDLKRNEARLNYRLQSMQEQTAEAQNQPAPPPTSKT